MIQNVFYMYLLQKMEVMTKFMIKGKFLIIAMLLQLFIDETVFKEIKHLRIINVIQNI